MMQTRASRATVAGLVLAIVATLIGVAVVRADDVPTLPSVAPAELVASVLAADPRTSLAGRVETRIDLGLPDLPTGAAGGIGSPFANVVGEQQYRVWTSANGIRFAHLLPMSEEVLVANAEEAWWWSSDGMQAVRLAASAHRPMEAGRLSAGALGAFAGADLVGGVRRVLARLAPWAEVRSDATSTVAGRAAYVLTLVPRSDVTLIGAIHVSVDAETRIPLRFEVLAKDTGRPAITAEFTDVSFDPVDPATFEFVAPVGAEVRDLTLPEDGDAGTGAEWWSKAWRSFADGGSRRGSEFDAHRDVRAFGDGFDLRLARRLDGPLPAEVASLLPYQGPLGAVLVVDRPSGPWLLAGPVALATLRSDADALP